MLTGPLVTAWAVAVIVAVPLIGFPCASLPLHTTKVESQTPPQTSPAGEMVATAVLEELKVNVVLTALLVAFTAEALTVTTCPETREIVVGVISTWATVVLVVEEEPLPQPTASAARTAAIASPAGVERVKTVRGARLPWLLKIRCISINIEEFSV
jgi:hypothetical protein